MVRVCTHTAWKRREFISSSLWFQQQPKMSVNSGNASFDSSSSQGIYKPLINNSAFTTEDRIRIQEQWHRETTLTSYCSLRRFATILFSVVTMTGQLMQYLSLPLWIDSTSHSKGTSTNQTVKRKPSLDSYFVVSFASFSFVIVFGSVILLCDCIFPKYLVTTDWRYRRLLLLVGLIMGTAAMFIVFSSSGKRTPPYLQAILGNFSIPFTILLRWANAHGRSLLRVTFHKSSYMRITVLQINK